MFTIKFLCENEYKGYATRGQAIQHAEMLIIQGYGRHADILDQFNRIVYRTY